MKDWISSLSAGPDGDTVSVTVGVPEPPPPTAQDYEMVPVDRITTHPDNARQGNMEVIRESIRVNGFYGACVVQRSTAYILIGNHRYRAAVEEGLTEVPIVWVDKSDEEARRLLLVDNRTSDLSGHDDDLLAILLAAVEQDDDGLLGTGYNDSDLPALLALLAPDGDFDYGNVSESLTPAERLPAWEAGGIRSLILPFPVDGFGEVVQAMADARARLDVDNNSDALRGLLGL